MNIQQLEYLLAVARFRHFAQAAAACHVTQPTLSMMIQKLEEELGVKLLDRSQKPVVPTEIGEAVIIRARRVLNEVGGIRELAQAYRGEIEGSLSLGVIPTLAPYLVPLFAGCFLDEHPKIKLRIGEYTTEEIIRLLQRSELDIGIMATPLGEKSLREIPLFYEAFVVYTRNENTRNYLLPGDIDPSELWLLEASHCFHSQVMNLCELRQKSSPQLDYAAGSIETLIQLVESQKGSTILPELATRSMSAAQKQRIRLFLPPAPAREVSLVIHQDFARNQILEALQQAILESLPEELQIARELRRIEIGR